MHRFPGANNAWGRAAERTTRQLLAPCVGGESRRRKTRTIDPVESAVIVHEREAIAAQAAGMREHDREHCRSGNRGIHRVAACAQHVESHRRRQWMACDHCRLATVSNLNRHRWPNLVPRVSANLPLRRRYDRTSRGCADGKPSFVLAPR
jgi:hypothetical protein